MKLISEVQKHRLREMLAGTCLKSFAHMLMPLEGRKEELYFEQNFPEGSEARKVAG